jgi:hypothetical protein
MIVGSYQPAWLMVRLNSTVSVGRWSTPLPSLYLSHAFTLMTMWWSPLSPLDSIQPLPSPLLSLARKLCLIELYFHIYFDSSFISHAVWDTCATLPNYRVLVALICHRAPVLPDLSSTWCDFADSLLRLVVSRHGSHAPPRVLLYPLFCGGVRPLVVCFRRGSMSTPHHALLLGFRASVSQSFLLSVISPLLSVLKLQLWFHLDVRTWFSLFFIYPSDNDDLWRWISGLRYMCNLFIYL